MERSFDTGTTSWVISGKSGERVRRKMERLVVHGGGREESEAWNQKWKRKISSQQKAI